MQKIALIFSIFNKLEYTKKGLSDIYDCFEAKSSDILPVNIVITDDGSTDGSYEWIKNNYPDIHVLKGDGTLWWSGGINRAAHHAIEHLNNDYILLWNNDIEPQKTYFKNLFQLLEENDTNNIICSKIYMKGTNDTIFSMGGNFNPRTGRQRLNGNGIKNNEYYNIPKTADWFPGMGTIIHKKIFDKIGFFDEKKFPQYHGDADFALRARKAGFIITAYPQLIIWNDRSNTGLSNNSTFTAFIKSLYTLKSNFNVCRDISFYNRHATSFLAYGALINKYFRHIGGYIKWKFLGLFGLRRKRIS
jgi:GT2 family glycosyltransferase